MSTTDYSRTGILESFPKMSLETISLLRVPLHNLPTDELVRIISRDPALAARVLQRSNSPRFCRSREIKDLKGAVVNLGVVQVHRFAVAFGMKDAMRLAGDAAMLPRIYKHSVATACVARSLMADLSAVRSGQAYLLGLLSTVGVIAVAAVDFVAYSAVIRQPASEGFRLSDWETSRFGVDHRNALDWLLESWQLPKELTLLLAETHSEHPASETAWVAVAARSIAGSYGFPLWGPQLAADPEEILREFSLSDLVDGLPSREEVHEEVAEMAA